LLTSWGVKDLASLNEHIKSDRSLYATSGQQLVDLYNNYVQQMEPEQPKLFGRLPKSKLVAIPMEASRSKNAVPADYTEGTADGSRPGHINVNEWDPEHRLLLNVEAIAYHEGIPGHHLQRRPPGKRNVASYPTGCRLPVSTKSIGRANRWWNTSIAIPPWTSPTFRAKWTATCTSQIHMGT